MYDTDLAWEAKRLWERSAKENGGLRGVLAEEDCCGGVPIHTVKILTEEGERQLGKPCGTYITVEPELHSAGNRERFAENCRALAKALRTVLPPVDRYLAVGLGNRDIISDSIGPEALHSVIATRKLPGLRGKLPAVSCIAPGVLGATGMDSRELVSAAARQVEAQCLIVIDALAAGEPERICTTVQVTDAGITPGSGVQHGRKSLNGAEMGIPVIAVGVPTVMDGGYVLSRMGFVRADCREDLILTPRRVDVCVRELGRLLGYGIDLALYPSISPEKIAELLH